MLRVKGATPVGHAQKKSHHLGGCDILRNVNFIEQETHIIFSVGYACLGPKHNCLRIETAKRQMDICLSNPSMM